MLQPRSRSACGAFRKVTQAVLAWGLGSTLQQTNVFSENIASASALALLATIETTKWEVRLLPIRHVPSADG